MKNLNQKIAKNTYVTLEFLKKIKPNEIIHLYPCYEETDEIDLMYIDNSMKCFFTKNILKSSFSGPEVEINTITNEFTTVKDKEGFFIFLEALKIKY